MTKNQKIALEIGLIGVGLLALGAVFSGMGARLLQQTSTFSEASPLIVRPSPIGSIPSISTPATPLILNRTPASGPEPQPEILTLGSSNLVLLRGPVTDESGSKAQKKLLEISHSLSPEETIYLVLDTPGGSIPAGANLITTAQGLPQKVKTVTLFAASMGFQIAQALDERLVAPNGTLMSHRARFEGIGGEVGSEGEGQLVTRLRWSIRQLEVMDVHASERMGIDLPTYQTLIRPEYWVDGADAVRAHAADRVIRVSCSAELLAGSSKETMDTPFGQVGLEFSNCPLISYPLNISMQGLKFGSTQEERDFRAFLGSMLGDRQGFVKDFIVNNHYLKYIQ